MKVLVEPCAYGDIEPMRDAYRAEAGCQIVYDSILRRGMADPYLLIVDGRAAGYAGVWNKYDPGRLMEIHMTPGVRADAPRIFQDLLETARPTEIEAQTNMPFMLSMFFDCATDVQVQNVLFGDAFDAELGCPNAIFRSSRPEDGKSDEWVLDVDGTVVASGGYLTHYNPPYADVYMEVEEAHRRKGYGAFFVQEVKRACRAAGLIPSARCNADNPISRKTLARAGMLPVGRLLAGKIDPVRQAVWAAND